jgi:hypothetical protein
MIAPGSGLVSGRACRTLNHLAVRRGVRPEADGHAERRAALAMIHRHSPGSTRRLTVDRRPGFTPFGSRTGPPPSPRKSLGRQKKFAVSRGRGSTPNWGQSARRSTVSQRLPSEAERRRVRREDDDAQDRHRGARCRGLSGRNQPGDQADRERGPGVLGVKPIPRPPPPIRRCWACRNIVRADPNSPELQVSSEIAAWRLQWDRRRRFS